LSTIINDDVAGRLEELCECASIVNLKRVFVTIWCENKPGAVDKCWFCTAALLAKC